MSLVKKLMGIALAASMLGGCASTAPKTAGDLFLQYSNIADKVSVLKEKKKAVGNPFEYQINDLVNAYESGHIKDFDQDFDNHYGGLTKQIDKSKALALELLVTFPSGINYNSILANDCKSIGDGKYSCDIGTVKSGVLDARMAAYQGGVERIKSENWREWSNFSEPLSASIWATALSYAFASKGGAAACQSLGAGSSTSVVGDSTTIGSLGSSTSSGTVGVGGKVVIDLLSGNGC